jgi:uncharacterized damage-inducible protein DinB
VTNQELYWKLWDREQDKFERMFDAVPSDRLDYRPHPKSRSAAEMVTLLAREQEMLCGMLDSGELDFREFGADPLDEMRALWKKSTNGLRERLQKLDDATWNKPVKFRMGGKVANEQPANQWLWGFLHDMIHHRGQLSTYIRPMGGKVPSVYGPSGDAPPA